MYHRAWHRLIMFPDCALRNFLPDSIQPLGIIGNIPGQLQSPSYHDPNVLYGGEIRRHKLPRKCYANSKIFIATLAICGLALSCWSVNPWWRRRYDNKRVAECCLRTAVQCKCPTNDYQRLWWSSGHSRKQNLSLNVPSQYSSKSIDPSTSEIGLDGVGVKGKRRNGE